MAPALAELPSLELDDEDVPFVEDAPATVNLPLQLPMFVELSPRKPVAGDFPPVEPFGTETVSKEFVYTDVPQEKSVVPEAPSAKKPKVIPRPVVTEAPVEDFQEARRRLKPVVNDDVTRSAPPSIRTVPSMGKLVIDKTPTMQEIMSLFGDQRPSLEKKRFSATASKPKTQALEVNAAEENAPVKNILAKDQVVEDHLMKKHPVEDEAVLDGAPMKPSVTDEPLTESSVKSLPVVDASGKVLPMEDGPLKDGTLKVAPVMDASVEDEPAKDVILNMPVKDALVQNVTVGEACVKDEPLADVPAREAHVNDEPVKEFPVKDEAVKPVPVKDTSVVAAPVMAVPLTKDASVKVHQRVRFLSSMFRRMYPGRMCSLKMYV